MTKSIRSLVLHIVFFAASSMAQSFWTWRNPLPQGDGLVSLAWSGKQYVAVGGNGALIGSPDGVDWTDYSAVTGNAKMAAVVWGGGQFVAVGDNQIVHSMDGINWKAVSGYYGSYGDYFNGLKWIDGAYVAVGDFGRIQISTDGEKWGDDRTLSQPDLYAVASIGKNRVVLGWAYYNNRTYPTVYVSTSGSAWKVADSTAPKKWLSGLLETDSILYGLGDSGKVWKSKDGISWSSASTGTYATLQTITAGNGAIVVLADSNLCLTSTDGSHWIRNKSNHALSYGSVMWDGRRFLGVGGYGAIQTSTDGILWDELSSGRRDTLNAIARTDTNLVLVGSSGAIATSSDGIQWAWQSVGTKENLKAVAWTGSRLVTIGDRGGVYSSGDGLSWSKDTSLSDGMSAIVAAGGKMVAVGKYGQILVSADGRRWGTQNSGTKRELTDIVWSGSQFVAVGSGAIVSSVDGLSWSKRPIPDSTSLISKVVWAGTQFVALSSIGAVFVSPNGEDWTITDTISANLGLYWTGKKLVAVGVGYVYSSVDGVKWNRVPEMVRRGVRCMGGIGNLLVVAGMSGMIATSPETGTSESVRGRAVRKATRHAYLVGRTLRFDVGRARSEILEARIRSLDGRQNLVCHKLTVDGNGMVEIPLGSIPAGPYVLEVEQAEDGIRETFVLIR